MDETSSTNHHLTRTVTDRCCVVLYRSSHDCCFGRLRLVFSFLLLAVSLPLFALRPSAELLAQSTTAVELPRVLVVRPSGWEKALEEWKRYRSKEYRIIELDSISNPHALRAKMLETARQEPLPCEAVVLCGSVMELQKNENRPEIRGAKAGQLPVEQITILTPSFQLETSVKLGPGTTPNLATDSLFGDFDDDGCPEVPVGRIPAQNPTELKRLLARSIEYESSTDMGEWRDKVHVTAGVGGFGMLADAAIETVARRYLSEGLPDRFRIQMTYASLTSPYCPDPFGLKKCYIDQINRGGLFWVYIGHGWIDRLDTFRFGDRVDCLCNPEDVKLFDVQNGAPIAILLACYTCAIDARVDCFANRLLAQPNGPIAVIGGSRVTMPYGMSQLAGEMIENTFTADRKSDPTLGRVVANSKLTIWKETEEVSTQSAPTADKDNPKTKFKLAVEQMAKALSPENHSLLAERREHVRLMHLLGDPLLKIRRPKSIFLKGDEQIASGAEFEIRGEAPWKGNIRVELRLHRDQLPSDIKSIGRFDSSPAQRETMQSNYEKANNLVIWSNIFEVESGDFRIQIPIPATAKGRHVIWTRMQQESDWAIGTHRITVKRPR